MGNVLFQVGASRTSRAGVATSLRSTTTSSTAHQDLGTLMMLEMADLDGAIKHLELAVHQAPRNLSALMNLGLAYAKRGALPQAARVTEPGSELGQDDGARRMPS